MTLFNLFRENSQQYYIIIDKILEVICDMFNIDRIEFIEFRRGFKGYTPIRYSLFYVLYYEQDLDIAAIAVTFSYSYENIRLAIRDIKDLVKENNEEVVNIVNTIKEIVRIIHLSWEDKTMPSFNQCTLVGNVGRIDNLGKLTKIALAINEYKKKDDKWETTTDWFNVVFFDKLGEYAYEKLKKGDLVMIVGKIKINTYEKEGKMIRSYDIIGNKLMILPRQNLNSEYSQVAPETATNNYSQVDDDGVPF